MVKSTKRLMAAALCVAAAGAHAQSTPIDPLQVRVWAASCAACHGTAGHAQPGMASLAGRSEAELTRLMLDFKADRKPATVMHQLAKGFSDEQIQQISAYFAAQPK